MTQSELVAVIVKPIMTTTESATLMIREFKLTIVMAPWMNVAFAMGTVQMPHAVATRFRQACVIVKATF